MNFVVDGLKKNKSYFSFKYLLFITGTFFFTVFFALIFSYFLLVKFKLVNLFFSISEVQSVAGMNLLIFGIDETQNTNRSDAILVVHLDKQSERVGLLSIPRDTRVKIKGHAKTRINHAFSYGGVSLLKDTVSNFLDIPIDHYIQINLTGVEKFIDALGGVEIDVKKELVYVDYAGDLYINVKAGKQKMMGKKAIEYLRFRQDDEGDIGRIKRQQFFLSSLVKEVSSFDNVFRFPKLIKALNELVKTDLSLKELTSLGIQFKKALTNNNISKSTVPGRVSLIGGAYYWKPNIKELDLLVDEVLFGYDFTSSIASTKLEKKRKELNLAKKENSYKVEKLDFIPENNRLNVKTESLDNFAKKSLDDQVYNEVKKTETLIASTISLEPQKETVLNLDNVDDDLNLKKEINLNPKLEQQKTDSTIKSSKATMRLKQEKLDFNTEISVTQNEIVFLDTNIVDNIKKDTSKKSSLINLVKNVKKIKIDNSNQEDLSSLKSADKLASVSNEINHEDSSKVARFSNEQNRRRVSINEVKRFANVNGEVLLTEFEGLKCEILNGIGVNGVAKSAAKILKTFGISVPRFANAGHFDYEQTIIVDWHGSVNKSLELALLLEIDPNNIIVYDNKSKPLNFTLVIGKDWFDKKELLERLNES